MWGENSSDPLVTRDQGHLPGGRASPEEGVGIYWAEKSRGYIYKRESCPQKAWHFRKCQPSG